MSFILGLAEGSTVDLILGGLAFFIAAIGVFLRLKAKSDRTDTMKEVEIKISEEIKPIKDRMEKHDTDFKEFKRDEITPIKQDVIDIQQKNAVMSNVLETLVRNIDSNHRELKEIMKERDKSYKETFLLLFERIDRKQDKK